MNNFMDRYKEIKEEIHQYALEEKNKFLLGLVSFLLSLLIVVGPITLPINCFIFNDFFLLIILGLGVCFFVLLFLTRFFYYQGITQKRVNDMHVFYLMEALVCFSITVVCLLILFFI